MLVFKERLILYKQITGRSCINGMEEAKKKLIEGVSLSLSLLMTSIILYFIPDFLGYQLVTRSIGVILGLIGILGFTAELTNMKYSNEEFKSALKDLSVAIFLGVLIFILLTIFSNWFTNLLVTTLMLIAFYAVFRSILKMIILTDFTKRNMIVKLPLVILNLAVFTLTILQLLQIFKVIEK